MLPPNSFARPRESVQCIVLALAGLWNSAITLVGFILYLIIIRRFQFSPWTLIIAGFLGGISSFFLMEWLHHFSLSFLEMMQMGFQVQLLFWKVFLTQGLVSAVKLSGQAFFYNYFGFSLGLASVLGLSEWIPNTRHEPALKALQRGQTLASRKLSTPLKLNYPKKNKEGTFLGKTCFSQEPVIIPDAAINQMLLVLGTTGAGKTITLRRFYQRALEQQYPLILIDGKPTQDNVAWLKAKATYYQRTFYGFNCAGYHHYDPLAHGGYTELKDKLISLKDHWENDYYRSIAEDYLQTTFEVFLHLKESFDLKSIVRCLDYEALAVKARNLTDESLKNRVQRLQRYDSKDITGLHAHLNLLIHSELGRFFEKTENTFNLADIIQTNSIVYFALPALRFPSFAKVLGKLIINDIKAVIDRLETKQRIFTVFDEFSVFAGEQVLNLVNMGRGKGIHAIFGTQGLADLKRVDPEFESQLLNCINTVICHRLNDHNSAEAIATWAGTQDGFEVTAQISEANATGMGSVKRSKSYLIHPDHIKQDLHTGEAFVITKVGGFHWDKVKVIYS